MAMVDVRAPARQLDPTDPDQMMGIRAVATRYNVSLRTVDRWLERHDLAFPRPAMLVGIRRYWRLGALIAWERAQAIRSATRGKSAPVTQGG
jgi:predicted DNA-binding transcriptional regulator AlpA